VWAITGLLRLGLSLDVRAACVFTLPAQGNHVAFYAGTLLVSLGLKVAALPSHGWLFAFYTNLPLNAILSYFQLYYLFFLIMVGRLIQGTLGDLGQYWVGGLALLVVILSVMLTSLVGDIGRLKHALAASSILNTTLVLFVFLP
jgi:NADH:ubiquinone oxidoreductase subunit 2 (subunit N)